MNKTLLIIDDDAGICEVVSELFKNRGTRVDSALCCGDGIKKLEEEIYDAVMLDLNLLNESGIQCLRTIHTKWPQLPVVIVTGYPDEVLKRRTIEEGADEYVTKDVLPMVLIQKVESAIRRSKSRMLINKDKEESHSELERIEQNLRRRSMGQ